MVCRRRGRSPVVAWLRKSILLACVLLACVLLACGCEPATLVGPPNVVAEVAGQVVHADTGHPISQARVRIKGEEPVQVTDQQGRFRLTLPQRSGPHTLTAAHPEFVIGSTACPEPTSSLAIRLRPIPQDDNEDYHWVDPRPQSEHLERCGNCHAEIFDEWSQDGHAHAARNPRFRSLFDGHDWHGKPAPGWSLAAEYPLGQTVCWSCHIPASDSFVMADPELPHPDSVAGQGIHCDYCHKVEKLADGKLGLMHGRFAVHLKRPSSGQLFFGPLDDVDRGEDVYSPLQHQSEFCATCHEGVVFGVHVYRTYSEWLRSPAKQRGQQCQDCHMRPTGRLTNVAPGYGGIERSAGSLASHAFLRGDRETSLRSALPWQVTSQFTGHAWQIHVAITSHQMGHHFPTGYIDRQLVLELIANDAQGQEVDCVNGDQLPDLLAPPTAGRAGKLFARILVDDHGQRPAPFWRHVSVEQDETLAPEQTWQGTYEFPAATHEVIVSLTYRRFWEAVRADKGWPDDSCVIHRQRLLLQR